MIAIGRYLLLFISLTELTISVNSRFSEEDIAKFLDYIYRLHNAVRTKHGVQILRRTYEMDVIASQKLIEWENVQDVNDPYLGVLLKGMYYYDNNPIQLNVAEAIKFFSLSYEHGNFYNYNMDPITSYADDFTQIVWKETDQIGITFKSYDDRYIVLAVYYLRGNIEGEYTSNVLPPINNRPAKDPEIDELIYLTEKEKLLDNIFKLHNQARIKHGVPFLKREDYLDSEANFLLRQNWLEETEYGINWFTFMPDLNIKLGDEAVANYVFSTWCNGEDFHDYDDKPSSNYTARFTQIVWQNTKKFGIGIQKNFFGDYKVIALYEPRENIPGEFVSNVLKPQSMDQGESSGNNN